uniref:Uncharacterized protein n=1 Tax=Globodera rostochiensis TaxID=31243 RepID=A0A914GY23_GLORO
MHCQRNAAKIASPPAMSTLLRLLYIVPISFSLLLLHIESSAVVHAFPSSSSAAAASAAAILAQRQQNRHNAFNLMRQASVAPLAALVLQDEEAAETVPSMLMQVGENDEQPADADDEAEQQPQVDNNDDGEEAEQQQQVDNDDGEEELVEEKRKSSRGQDAETVAAGPRALACGTFHAHAKHLRADESPEAQTDSAARLARVAGGIFVQQRQILLRGRAVAVGLKRWSAVTTEKTASAPTLGIFFYDHRKKISQKQFAEGCPIKLFDANLCTRARKSKNIADNSY